MTGTSGCSARSSRNSAMPSSPEVASRRKFMSWITRSTSWDRTVASASAGDEAPSTRAPCRDNRTWKAVRTASLSSATSTVRFARRSSTFEVTEVMRMTLGVGLGLQRADTFEVWLSDVSRGHRRRYLRGTQGWLPGGELAHRPQTQHPADEVVEVEPRHLVLVGQPEPGREREAAADQHADGCHQPVLDHEVADDVAAPRADRPARTDLARPVVHVERGETEDAEGAEDEDQPRDRRQRDRHQRIPGVAAALHAGHLVHLSDHAVRIP